MKILLLFLAVIPLGAHYWAKNHRSENLFFIVGLTAGLVISPVSIGLTGFLDIPVLGQTLGYLGVILNLVHGIPGYFMAASVNLIEKGTFMSTPDRIIVEVLNGFLWASAYGFIGYSFDAKKSPA